MPDQIPSPMASNSPPSPNAPPPSLAPQPSSESAQPTATPNMQPDSSVASDPQPSTSQSTPGTQQPSTATQPTVSNPLPPAAAASIQRAGVLRTIAQTLAGGPRYKETIDPQTGTATRTEVPLSRSDIALAIVSEVLSGAMSGLSAKPGPGVEGRAAAAGFNQAVQSRQRADAQQQQQADQDYQNQVSLLSRRAQIYEANSRTLLNTSEAEQQGGEAIDKLADINRQSGILDISPDLLDNGGRPMTQQELNDGMRSGKLSATGPAWACCRSCGSDPT